MTNILYATATMSHEKLMRTLRRFKRHSKVGFYVVAEDRQSNPKDKVVLYDAQLYGPKLYWKRKNVWELKVADAPRITD